jgi:hypothetical protein
MTSEERPRDPAEATDEEMDEYRESISERLVDPSATVRTAMRQAGTLDHYTGRRFSRTLGWLVLLLPIGCAFLAAFGIAVAVTYAVLAFGGLLESQVAGVIGLAVALAFAVVVALAVFRLLIFRVPWLRRLINR